MQRSNTLRLIIYISIFIANTLISSVSSRFKCKNAYECYDTTINVSESIFCRGGFSCAQSSISMVVQTGTGVALGCYGSYSCYNAKKIQMDGNNQKDIFIECMGLYSCSNIKNIYALDANIDCMGELSCFGSILTTETSLTCDGGRSCMNMIVNLEKNEAKSEVSVSSYLGALNATFNVGDSASVDFTFSGVYSATNVTILCGEDANCNIACYSNACNQIKRFACLHVSGNCVLNIDCSNAEESTFCLKEYGSYSIGLIGLLDDYSNYSVINYTYLLTPDIPNSIKMTNYNNSFNVYNLNSTIVCGDSNGCYSDTLDTSFVCLQE